MGVLFVEREFVKLNYVTIKLLRRNVHGNITAFEYGMVI